MTSAEDIARVTGTKSDYQAGRDDEREYQREEWAMRCCFAAFAGMVAGAFAFGLFRQWVGG